MTVNRHHALVLLATGATTAGACNAVLGIEEYGARALSGGDGGIEASARADGGHIEAGEPDGAFDAAAIDSESGAESGGDGGSCGNHGELCCVGSTCTPPLGCQTAICCNGGETVCGGACVNTDTDNGNCGGCGIACGGKCTSARCIVTVASGQNQPWGVAVDSTSVYWTNTGSPVPPDGTVVRAPLAGVPEGGSPVTLASSQAGPEGIVVAGDSVYWANEVGSTVMRVSLDGGTPLTIASSQNTASHVTTDSADIYWAAGYFVVKAPLDGGAIVTLAGSQDPIRAIALDLMSIYWITNGNPSSILKAPKVPFDGGTPITVASGLITPSAIAIDGTNLYWTDQQGGLVMRGCSSHRDAFARGFRGALSGLRAITLARTVTSA